MPRARWPNACAWPSRTSPSAPPSWKRAICGATGRCTTSCAKFWNEVATGNGHDFVEGKLAERDAAPSRARAKAAISSSPTSRKAKGGLRDLQTLYWIGKYLYHVDDPRDLVEHGVFTHDEYKTFQKAEAFLWKVRVHLHYLAGRAEERLSFDVQPELAKRLRLHRSDNRAAPSKPSCAPTSWWPRMSAI